MTEAATQVGPVEHRIHVNGVELACFEWGAAIRGDLPSILMVHATGFHARVWDQVIGRLGPRHVVSVDQRGHGRSARVLIDHWGPLGQDLAEVVDHFDLKGAIGVGHSMGGHALVDAAAARPGAFERLLLIDPVISSPDDYRHDGWSIDLPEGESHPTSRRKNDFASVKAMVDRFRDRAPYSYFEAAVLQDYCQYGLLPAAQGDGLELACSPDVEASVYMTSRTNPAVHDSVRAIEVPVMIMRAKLPPEDRDVMDFSSSPTWPGLVGEFRQGREIYLPDHTHFLPMEDPGRVVRYILDYDPSQ